MLDLVIHRRNLMPYQVKTGHMANCQYCLSLVSTMKLSSFMDMYLIK